MINQAQGIIIDQKWTYMWLCIKSVKAKLHLVAIIWMSSCHCPSAHAWSLLLLLLSFCILDLECPTIERLVDYQRNDDGCNHLLDRLDKCHGIKWEIQDLAQITQAAYPTLQLLQLRHF